MRTTVSLVACICGLLLPAARLHAQVKPTTMEEMRKLHQDSKAYIAMLENPARDAEQKPQEVMMALGLKEGERIADIGAGTGYFSERLAKCVGPRGRVLAIDIQPEMLSLLTNRMRPLGITNVTPVFGKVSDPGLQPASVDLALLVDVYHEFAFPYEMMQHVCEALKPGGRVVLVEYRTEDPAVPIKPVHKMSEAQVRREMAAQPLEWVETNRVLPWQNIFVFKKRG